MVGLNCWTRVGAAGLGPSSHSPQATAELTFKWRLIVREGPVIFSEDSSIAVLVASVSLFC